MDVRARALHDVDDQLDRLRRQLADSIPGLYRDLALYLQVLRKALPDSVQQACFTLASRHADGVYGDLPSPSRQALHRRLNTLLQRCTSLLTVEQLAVLGGQLQRQRLRAESDSTPPSGREQHLPLTSASPDELVGALPAGSVHLDFAPPLRADFFGPSLTLAASSESTPASTPIEPPPPGEAEALQLLLALSLQGARPDPFDPERENRLLPDDPLALLAWWDRFDQALQRRLRNLSHAINVEFLRIGLSHQLLPVHLLDAVLGGQIDPLPAPANLLRLQLPLPQMEATSPLEVVGLLLRCSDLEHEQPRLRTCRQRLRKRQQELRRMAQQFRHWQRRAQVLEAEQLWLQDTRTKTPPQLED